MRDTPGSSRIGDASHCLWHPHPKAPKLARSGRITGAASALLGSARDSPQTLPGRHLRRLVEPFGAGEANISSSPPIAILPPVRAIRSRAAPSSSYRVFAAIPVFFCLLALAGCGTVVSQEKLQDAVQASLEDSIHEKIQAVECPSDQSVDPGATFTCSVIFSDHRREIATLEIRDKEADISMIDLKPEK